MTNDQEHKGAMETVRHTRKANILGVCLAALIALTAITASAASASEKLPEWGVCTSALEHEGKYGDANCTEPVKKVDGKYTGGYEWHGGQKLNAFEELRPIAGYSFKYGEIGPTTFETTTGKQITCPVGELYQLEVESSKDVGDILVNFYGCESEGEPCRSEYHFEGEITDENQWRFGEGLKGELVYASGRKSLTPSVGLTLTAFRKAGEVYEHGGEPVTATGALFTVACNGHLGDLEIGGAGGKKEQKAKGNAAISLISPVDQRSGEYTETFSQTGGVQEPLTTENGKERSLQMYDVNEHTWTQMGLSTGWTMTAESRHPVEIKAIK